LTERDPNFHKTDTPCYLQTKAYPKQEQAGLLEPGRIAARQEIFRHQYAWDENCKKDRPKGVSALLP
jgi:hypothetical protein